MQDVSDGMSMHVLQGLLDATNGIHEDVGQSHPLSAHVFCISAVGHDGEQLSSAIAGNDGGKDQR